MASFIGEKLGGIGHSVDYSMLNKPKTTRKWVFWIVFILGAGGASYFVYSDYSKDKKSPNSDQLKPTSEYITKLVLLILGVFVIAFIFGFLVEVFGTMNLKQAILMCKRYGFEEGTPQFQKCLIDEQRARETRQMIAASYMRN